MLQLVSYTEAQLRDMTYPTIGVLWKQGRLDEQSNRLDDLQVNNWHSVFGHYITDLDEINT